MNLRGRGLELALGAALLLALLVVAFLTGVLVNGSSSGGELAEGETNPASSVASVAPSRTAAPSATSAPSATAKATATAAATATPAASLEPASTPSSANAEPQAEVPSTATPPSPTQAPVPTATIPANQAAPEPGSGAAAATETVVSPVFPTETPTPNPPPNVVAVEPNYDATGVHPGRHFVVTFSEPMDQASTEAALRFESSLPGYGLKTISGSFSWNAGGTVMTYDTDVDIDYNARVFWSIGNTASDLHGASLLPVASGKFDVWQQSTWGFFSQAGRDGSVLGPGYAAAGGPVDTSSPHIRVSEAWRGYVSFDLSQLPADLIEITDAVVSIYVDSVSGYYGLLGPVVIRPFQYGTPDTSDYDPLLFCVVGVPCTTEVFSTSDFTLGEKLVDVTEWVRLDWDNRNGNAYRSQYRLRLVNDQNALPGDSASVIFLSGETPVGSTHGPNPPILTITFVHP